MSASWDINDEDVKEEYIRIYEAMYIPLVKDDIKTVVTIGTSDTGTSGANIWYTIECDDTSLVIGNAIKLNHRGTASIMDYKNNLKGVFAGYKKAFENLNKLKSIEILNPEGCIKRLAKRADLPAKYAKMAAERFVLDLGDEPTTALNIYAYGINAILAIAKKAGESTGRILTYQEKVARCLQMEIKDFDKAVEQ
jgi:hypothetical protein